MTLIVTVTVTSTVTGLENETNSESATHPDTVTVTVTDSVTFGPNNERGFTVVSCFFGISSFYSCICPYRYMHARRVCMRI